MICSGWSGLSYILTCPAGGIASWCYCTKWGSSQGLLFVLRVFLFFKMDETFAFFHSLRTLSCYHGVLISRKIAWQTTPAVSLRTLGCILLGPKNFIFSFSRWSQTWSYPVIKETSFPHSFSWVSGLKGCRKRNYHWKLRQKILINTSGRLIVTSSAILWQGECIFFNLPFLANMACEFFSY